MKTFEKGNMNTKYEILILSSIYIGSLTWPFYWRFLEAFLGDLTWTRVEHQRVPLIEDIKKEMKEIKIGKLF